MKHGVLLGSVGLVALVASSLVVSRSMTPAAETDRPVDTRTFGELPGFRADLWYLPDEPLLGFVEIPAGPFLMGSDPAVDPEAFEIEQWTADQPRGTVELPTFYMSRYESTVAQYNTFVAATGTAVPDPSTLRGLPDHPVTGVAWTDAMAYARWLDETLRRSSQTPPELKALLESGYSVVVPSEAEWEKAARGADGRIYPWGEAPLANRANFTSQATTRVGTFGCTGCAHPLYDMAGNVWEWTRSPYQSYPYTEDDDAEGLDEDALWVMRGGSYLDPPHFVRAANRGGADPGARRPFIGFRVALSPE